MKNMQNVYMIIGASAFALYYLSNRKPSSTFVETVPVTQVPKDQVANAKHHLSNVWARPKFMQSIDSRAVFPSELTTHLE